MRTALQVSEANFDVSEKQFVASVREHGWYRTTVEADDHGPGFSYTSGFWQATGQPELILFGQDEACAHEVFATLYHRTEGGRPLAVGERLRDGPSQWPVYVFPVARKFYGDYLGWSLWFYRGDGFECQQIVWPDAQGRFPWQEGFDPALAGIQPDLTEHGWKATLARY